MPRKLLPWLVGGAALGGLWLLSRPASASLAPLPPVPPPGPGPAPSPPSPTPTPTPSGTYSAYVATQETPLNVRSGPSEDSAVVGTANKGDIVTVLDPNPRPATPAAPQGWLIIATAGGIQGFASAAYLKRA